MDVFATSSPRQESPRPRERKKVLTGKVAVASDTLEPPVVTSRHYHRPKTHPTPKQTPRNKTRVSVSLDTTGLKVYGPGQHSSPRYRTRTPAETSIGTSQRSRRHDKPRSAKDTKTRKPHIPCDDRETCLNVPGEFRYSFSCKDEGHGTRCHITKSNKLPNDTRTKERFQQKTNEKDKEFVLHKIRLELSRVPAEKFASIVTEHFQENQSAMDPAFIANVLRTFVPNQEELITDQTAGDIVAKLNPESLVRAQRGGNVKDQVAIELSQLFRQCVPQFFQRELHEDKPRTKINPQKLKISREEVEEMKGYFLSKQNPCRTMTAEQAYVIIKERARQKKAHDVFQFFDLERNGYVGKNDLSKTLEVLRVDISKQELNKLFNFLDKDKDGSFTLSDLTSVSEETDSYWEPNCKRYYRGVPDSYKTDGKSSPSPALQKAFLCSLQRSYPELFSSLPQSHQMAQSLLLHLDKDVDNVITTEEFYRHLKASRVEALSRFSQSPALSEEDVQVCKAVTEYVDMNKDGYIDIRDLRNVAEKLGSGVGGATSMKELQSENQAVYESIKRDIKTFPTMSKALQSDTRLSKALQDILDPRESPLHPVLKDALDHHEHKPMEYGHPISPRETIQLPSLNLSRIRQQQELQKNTYANLGASIEGPDSSFLDPSYASDKERLQSTTHCAMENAFSPRFDYINKWKKYDLKGKQQEATAERICKTYDDEALKQAETQRQRILCLTARREAVDEVNGRFRVKRPERKKKLCGTVSYDAQRSSLQLGQPQPSARLLVKEELYESKHPETTR